MYVVVLVSWSKRRLINLSGVVRRGPLTWVFSSILLKIVRRLIGPNNDHRERTKFDLLSLIKTYPNTH